MENHQTDKPIGAVEAVMEHPFWLLPEQQQMGIIGMKSVAGETKSWYRSTCRSIGVYIIELFSV